MSKGNYWDVQADIRARLGIERSTSKLLEQWDDFVLECEECYSWDVSEYHQELGVRDQLEAILEAPELQKYAEHQEVRRQVNRVDVRFQSLLLLGVSLPGKQSWWRAGVLSRAGSNYVEYFRDAHGIEVERC